MIPLEPPPKGVTPDFVHPVTLAREIVAVSTISSVLAIVLLCTRLYSTLKITRSAGYDDIACLCALVFSLAYVGLIIGDRHHARHAWDTPLSFATHSSLKVVLAETMILAVGFLCAKISILLLLRRLFALSKSSRYCVYIGILWTTLISVSAIIVDAALCAPRSGESFSSLQVIRRCSSQKTWSVVQGCLNVLLDFFILYIPIPIIWKLQLGRRKKIGVTTIFMTGSIACVASVLNLWVKGEFFAGSDVTWNSFRVDILNIVELDTAIIAACMPTCASFFRYLSAKANPLRSWRSRTATKTPEVNRDGNPASAYNGRYWRLKNSLSNGKNDLPPQIITHNQPTSLRTGRLDMSDVGDGASWPFAGRMKKKVGMGISFQEHTQTSTATPRDII